MSEDIFFGQMAKGEHKLKAYIREHGRRPALLVYTDDAPAFRGGVPVPPTGEPAVLPMNDTGQAGPVFNAYAEGYLDGFAEADGFGEVTTRCVKCNAVYPLIDGLCWRCRK